MKKLYRFKREGVLFGICAGFGEYFEVDPLYIRLFALFFCSVTGFIPLVVCYLIAAAVIPPAPINYTTGYHSRIYRSRSDKVIAGVCGGLGRRFRIDTTLIRLVVVLFGLFTGIFPMLITYCGAILLIPMERDDGGGEILID